MHRERADAAFLLQDAKEEQHLPCNYACWRCFLQNPLRGSRTVTAAVAICIREGSLWNCRACAMELLAVGRIHPKG